MNRLLFICLGLFLWTSTSTGQKKLTKADTSISAAHFSNIKFRSIGPAFMAGRIADIAIHPEDDNVWYVAVGSGGVWKTNNAGVTWDPIFDNQSVYSIGCVTIDPNNPHTVWVGTGENVGGRHVSFGDGIYKSNNGGKSWQNMGLPESEHISKIIVHPEHSNIVWVAVQGPLWNKGGERGLYMTEDGGETWERTLGNDEWTGVTDIVIDPRDPDVLYAATWDRHRTVAAYMGGGPGTGLHRSTDGGRTWTALKKGLPASNMGKIGLAISHQNPDVLYAAIELDRRKGGVYKSTNRGASWKKMSDAVSGATGPHYYQELYACPHNFDRLYLMDVRIQVSDDGGKTFRRLNEREKHSDNHAMAFRMDDPDYLLIGTDGGLYESFDLAQNWRFIANMPITQYYKLAVDDAEPFYNVYGGTQDNNTHGGPSRTDNYQGIRNGDWFTTVGGDGHQPATEPGNPDIVYSQSQQGNLYRVDMITGEYLSIRPQPAEGEPYERYNWDSPILVSPHNPSHLFFGSQRVWYSTNRGDTWTAISEDLTRNENRFELPIMGRQQSFDNPWDVYAMSNYNTITSLAESPVQEGLIYAGTDDGIIQVTEDGGDNWRKIEVGSIPGVPDMAFVNDIKADLYDASTAYVVLDNHKYGDFKPYIVKTTDAGRSWTSLASNLPEPLLLWRVVQDHVDPDLMFLGTEFGIYFTVDGGNQWVKFKGGLPTISFRDLAIQKRENDLIGASFGRSFYILDDYSFLRDIDADALAEEAMIFEPREALWYIPRRASRNAGEYAAPNPPFGATITYHLGESLTKPGQERRKKERELAEAGEDVPFPGWELLEEEMYAEKPRMWLIIRDSDNNIVRRLTGPTSKGIHRVTWDLRYPDAGIVRMGEEFRDSDRGFMVAPGTYTVTLAKEADGLITVLTDAVEIDVVPLHDEHALEGQDPQTVAAYWKRVDKLQGMSSAISVSLNQAMEKVTAMRSALYKSEADPLAIDVKITGVMKKLRILEKKLRGNKAKGEVGEKNDPTINDRLSFAGYGTSRTTYGPTEAHRNSLRLAEQGIADIKSGLNYILTEEIPALEKALKEVDAPWIEGQPLPGQR